jgi:hypothetical protein
MSAEAPLVPAPVYGLRTWTVVGAPGEERLSGPQRGGTWPVGGAWMEAVCTEAAGHAAPAAGCQCGIHAWHPSARAAARVLAVRRQVPGIVAGSGAIEVHEDGFRAQRAQPHAFVLAPGRNRALAERLATAYCVPVVEIARATELAEWCREHGLGLQERVVAELLGPAELAARRSARRRRARSDLVRLAAAVAVMALLLLVGWMATAPPGDRPLFGRTGPVHQQP